MALELLIQSLAVLGISIGASFFSHLVGNKEIKKLKQKVSILERNNDKLIHIYRQQNAFLKGVLTSLKYLKPITVENLDELRKLILNSQKMTSKKSK